MVFKKWDDLPENMKNESVRPYYEQLYKKRKGLLIKRIFDLVVAVIALVVFSPIFIILSMAIKLDSKGPFMFKQVRVTQYGKKFRIFKFRTMVNGADKIGVQVTTKNDTRVTRVGKFLRKLRLDEIPQLFNIILGDMSFVGTRPEVVEYVEKYTDDMMATLLLPAGVTSIASIIYKDEEKLLKDSAAAEEVYLNEILPEKMKYNLIGLEDFSLLSDIKTIFSTAAAMVKKNTVFKRVTIN